ncbi:type IV pilus modification protein PilV [Halomonas salinarum]|uniref:type IV pilus modification protein PilV n=1 Tax=Halomonas salinarum TaxID=1158993 RepID=UPI00143AA621|nr:type IV pilus modification protein PilV [Halomonas salinarum]
MSQRLTGSYHTRGFTLVEALVALLVLSIGLLGVASMQLKALQSAHAGYQRSIASLAAVDAQERTWSELATLGTCPNDAQISSVSTDWKGQWFGSGTAMSDAGNSDIEETDACEYKVIVNWRESRLEAGNGSFEYIYRLPNLSGS